MKKRLMAILLAAAMVFTMLPGVTQVAAAGADESGSIGNTSDTALQSLGFNTGTAQIESYMKDDANRPTGTQPFSLFTVNELAVATGDTARIYDLPNGTTDGKTEQKSFKCTSYGASYADGAQTRSVELDLNGTGKPDHIAQIYAFQTEAGSKPKKLTQFSVRLFDAASGNLVAERHFGIIQFQMPETTISSFLSITAGDYDNDGKDEIAVWEPAGAGDNQSWNKGEPNIGIYEYANGKLVWKKSMNISGNFTDQTYDKTNDMNADAREYPSVSLTTVRQQGECDDIVAAVSYARHADARKEGTDTTTKDNTATLAFWKDPLSSDSSTSRMPLHNTWEAYGKTGSDGEKNEIMMFPSVDAGDITGDGIPEVVVAGYRLENEDISNRNDWDLDYDRLLITYCSYLPAKKDYTSVSAHPMQWISTEKKNYNGAFDDSHTKFDNGGLSSEKDFMIPPPTVKIFAERGTGYNKSVFVAGYVLSLPTVNLSGASEQEFQMGMYGGYDEMSAPASSMNSGMSLMETFRIRYAAPLGYIENDDNGFVESFNERAIVEATAGNFDSNPMGKEQLAFVYLIKRSGWDDWYTVIGSIYQNADSTTLVGNLQQDEVTAANVTGVTFAAMGVTYRSDANAVTICAPDADNDSLIMRYNTKKAPDFYFSDPHIVAILQAAPYFKDVDYYSSPETSVSRTTGGGTTDNHAVSITASGHFGLHAEVSGGVGASMSLLEFELMFNFSGSVGYEMNHEKTSSITTTFNATKRDSVALSMSSYVRYYYEEWSPVQQKWLDSFFDIPTSTAVSQISVDLYDKIAAENGWKTLRKNILGNSQPGKPETYAVNPPSTSYANTGTDFDFKDGELVKLGQYDPAQQFIKTGTGDGAVSRAISMSESYENSVTWGASFEVEYHVRVAVIQGGGGLGIDYTGGHGSLSFNEASFAGSVPDIPEDQAGEYSFEWELGTWLAELSTDAIQAPDCVVVGYRVKNVHALPEAPLDLAIERTTTDSVTLTWSDNPDILPEYHVLSRVVNGFYYPIATMEASASKHYLFTDTNCAPGRKYEYAVQTYAYSRNFLMASRQSDIASAITPTLSGAAIILKGPQDVFVRAGQDAAFRVTLSQQSDSGMLDYQWKVKSENGWQNITGIAGKNPSLVLYHVTEDMSGNQYQCVVHVRIGTEVEELYLGSATLTVDKGDTETELSVTPEKGAAGKTVVETVPEDVTEYVDLIAKAPNGSEYFIVISSYDDACYLVSTNSQTYYAANTEDLDNLVAQAQANQTPLITLANQPLTITAHPQQFYQDKQMTILLFPTDILDTPPVPGVSPISLPTILGNDYPYTGTKYDIYTHDGNTVYAVDASDEVMMPGVDEFIAYYTESGGVFTEIYLSDTVYSIQDAPLTGFRPESLYQPEPISVTYQKGSEVQRFEGGDEVTLTASVREKTADNPLEPAGTVTFLITNINTGVKTSLYAKLVIGKAEMKWKAPAAGEYSIVAQYGGNAYLVVSESGEKTYLAYQTGGWLGLNGASAMTYGEALDLRPTYYDVDPLDPSRVTTLPLTPDSFAIDQSKAIVFSIANQKGSAVTDGSAVSSASGQFRFAPAQAGVYVITARYTDSSGTECSVTKVITVQKKTIVFQPLDQTLDISELTEPGAHGQNKAYDVTYPAYGETLEQTDIPENELASILLMKAGELTGTTVEELSVGSHPITVAAQYADEDASQYYDSRYQFVFGRAMLTITAPRHRVLFEAGVNGSLTSRIRDGAPLSTNNTVYDGKVVEFDAVPNNGYAIDQWTVKVGGTETKPSPDKYGIDVTATDDITVHVTFKAQTYRLSYSKKGSGQLSAHYGGANGNPISSGGIVMAQSTVYMKAAPDSGHCVKQWTVNGSVVKNQDGSIYTKSAYLIPNLGKNTTVSVEFTTMTLYSVSAKAVDINGNPLPSTLGAVSDNAMRLGNGKVASGSNFTITAAAVKTSGYQIREWRKYSPDGVSYTILQGKAGAFAVKNLQSNLDIRVVFETSQNFTLAFLVTGGHGTLQAKYGNVPLISGDSHQAYIPVTFTAIPDKGYGVAGWYRNGIKVVGAEKATYTLPALSENTKVTVRFVASSITLNTTKSNLLRGQKTTLKATVLPASLPDKKVVWSSSNPAAATVDQRGKVTAKLPGTAVITAASNGKKATCTVTVHAYVIMRVGHKKAITDGKKTTISGGSVTPVIIGGRTMLPLRFVEENMGAKVKYVSDKDPITVTYGGKVVSYRIGSKQIKIIEGKKTRTIQIDVAPQKRNGRLLVPVRATSEALGYHVYYRDSDRMIVVNNPHMTTAVREDRLKEGAAYIK